MLYAYSEPISIEKFIKPAVNLNEKEENKQIEFIGFVGSPGNYKKAQFFHITQEGKLEEREQFNFTLSSLEINTFFSAHKGNFTGQNKEELALLVSSPTVGTKVYLWEIKKDKSFERIYENPTTINIDNPTSQPIEALTTKGENSKNNITISFGSPNRNIVVLEFEKEKIKINNNIAVDFLQNQAGTIIIREFFEEQSPAPSLYIFNAGNPKESITINQNKNERQKYNIKGFVTDVYIKNNQNERKKILLKPNSLIFYSKENKKTEIPTKNKYIKILSEQNNIICLLDEKGKQYEINLGDKTEKEKTKENNKKKPEQLEFLYSENQILITTQTGETKKLYYQNIKKETQAPTKATSTDTLFIETNKQQNIPIELNKKLEFIQLVTKEQPEEMELDLTNMSYVWTPSTNNVGFHNLEYNILYNKPGKITKQKTQNGKTSLNKENQPTNKTQKTIIFVNDPPTIAIDSTYNITQGNKLNINIKTKDKNKNQKITTEFSPKLKGATLQGDEFVWTPETTHKGKYEIKFTANDGITTTTTNTHVFVDTIIQTTQNTEKYILTTNKEFTLDLNEEKTYFEYNKIKGPENLWISKKGKLHWIPITTQIGNNEINIERIGKGSKNNIIISAFVNSPPVISYRPDNIEYINLNEEFIFNLQAFDANKNQPIFWELGASPEGMILTETNKVVYLGQKPDFHTYIIEATDSIDTDVFYGQIYVNHTPQIISTPQEVIQLGETFTYNIEVEDKNEKSPNNKEEKIKFIYSLIQAPTKLEQQNNQLEWTPTKEDIGNHNIKINITDGLDVLHHNFSLYVNEAPQITSTNKLKILVGDTLTHFIAAKDQTKKNELTFSIRTTIKEMFLNANTGEINWTPKKEDIGKHLLRVAVSDGFEKSADVQEIEILVQGLPEFLSSPPTEAYVGLEYRHSIEAQNAKKEQTPKQDFFVEIEETTFSNMELDTINYVLFSTPRLEDAGKQKIKLKLSDEEKNEIIKTFEVLVIETSPCIPDTVETATIKQDKKTPKQDKKTKPPLFKIPH